MARGGDLDFCDKVFQGLPNREVAAMIACSSTTNKGKSMTKPTPKPKPKPKATPAKTKSPKAAKPAKASLAEIGGPKGPEPTRYGDWEQKGRCSDF